MGRNPRDMTHWTFYLPRRLKKRIEEMAEEATETAERTIRPSAVGRALMNLAMGDEDLVNQAIADAIAEPPSGPARSGLLDTETTK